jgi:NADPH:quinone reductase-like Zn-dependent oxidoreductase
VVVLDDQHARDQLPVFDGVADTVGGTTTQKLFDKIRRGGSIATVLDEPPGAREHGFEVRKIWAHPDAERLATLLRALAARTLVIPIAKRFQLAQIREAHEAAQRGAGGKVLVQM